MSAQDIGRRIKAIADSAEVRQAAAATIPHRAAVERRRIANLASSDAQRVEASANEAEVENKANLVKLRDEEIPAARAALGKATHAALLSGSPADVKLEREAERHVDDLEKLAARLSRALPFFEAATQVCANAARAAAVSAVRADDEFEAVDDALRRELARQRWEEDL